MKKLFVVLVITLSISPIYSQTNKKSPDELNGLKNIKFFTSIVDYDSYSHELLSVNGNTTRYEVYLPSHEKNFLNTQISRMVVTEQNSEIISFEVYVKNDIRDLLNKMFYSNSTREDHYTEKVVQRRMDSIMKDVQINRSFSNVAHYDTIKVPKLLESQNFNKRYNLHLSERQSYVNQFEKYETVQQHEILTYFLGNEKSIEYGCYDIWEIDVYDNPEYDKSFDPWSRQYSPKKFKYIKEIKLKKRDYYLKFYIDKPIDKYIKKESEEHYDSYFSDFDLDLHPSSNNQKRTYKIPLLIKGNTYYIRTLFGDVSANLILDTGADELIISKSLYLDLKSKGYITDEGSYEWMQTANGEIVSLKKIIIKSIQVQDLKLNNVEAFVNVSDNISLLGQSFLKRFGSINIDHSTNILTIKK